MRNVRDGLYKNNVVESEVIKSLNLTYFTLIWLPPFFLVVSKVSKLSLQTILPKCDCFYKKHYTLCCCPKRIVGITYDNDYR